MAQKAKAPGGRPPRFKSKEEMQAKIDAYYAYCAGRVLTDADGAPVLDKQGRPVMVDTHPITMGGMARFLGFSSRQSFLNYRAKKEFMDTTTRARARCEEYAEERLYDIEGSKGAQFSLRCNFGWDDKVIEEADEGAVTIVDDV